MAVREQDKSRRLLLIIADKDIERKKQIESKLSLSFRSIDNIHLYNSFGADNMKETGFQFDDLHIWINGIAVPRESSLKEVPHLLNDTYRLIGNKMFDVLPTLFSNGSYAIASVKETSLRVFNDFLGTYPVYYFKSDECLYISTSLKVIKMLVDLSLDPESVQEFVYTGMNLSGNTIYKGLKLLGPASVIEFDDGSLSIRQYDSFSKRVECSESPAMLEEIFEAYKSAVRRIYDPDLLYTLSLSGGMDSRMIFVNWPNPFELLTETAGRGTTDYLIADELVNRIGNPKSHLLEVPFRENYTDGFNQYYQSADNPSLLKSQYNMHHLNWKIGRGSDIHMSGVGGEYINGENLYISRKSINVFKEMLFNYKYSSIQDGDRADLIWNALRLGSHQDNLQFLGLAKATSSDYLNSIVNNYTDYIGPTLYREVFIERFRTYLLANSGFRSFSGVFDRSTCFLVLPNSDSALIQAIAQFHPFSRELRKLGFKILRKDKRVINIPVDTTHLPVTAPYFVHKFVRPIRMVVNKGFKMKIPLLQKGKSQAKSVFPYFMPEFEDLRMHIKDTIFSCGIFDNEKVSKEIAACNTNNRYNIYSAANLENILILYRLARTITSN